MRNVCGNSHDLEDVVLWPWQVLAIQVRNCPVVSRLLVTYCSSWKLVQCWGQQEFAIPDNVLGIVYGQTICWIGAFFSPLLPAIATLKLIIIFYVKEVRRRLGRGLIFWTILDLARHSAVV